MEKKLKKSEKKAELNQISLTGIRGLLILKLLTEQPRSLEELREKLIEAHVMSDSHSNDIIRIDLNTLRAIGCDISKANAKYNYKFVLNNHPFSLKITDEEIKLLKKIYNNIKVNADFETLIGYHKFFNKLAKNVSSIEQKEALSGISILKTCDTSALEQYIEDCKQKKQVKLIYKKPTSKLKEERDLVFQEIFNENDKIYINCFDINKKDSVTINIRRILQILSRKDNRNDIECKQYIVRFKLKNYDISTLNPNETVIETNDKEYFIEGCYRNDFWALQRILSFGNRATVVEPKDFREKIIETVKDMRRVYNG